MKTYILCRFEYGYTGNFYQVIENGAVVSMVDENGNELKIPGCGEDGFIPYGASVIDSNPPLPAWAQTQ